MFSQKQDLVLLIFPELNRTCNRKQEIITRLSKNHHRVLSRLCEEFEGAGDVSHGWFFFVCVCFITELVALFSLFHFIIKIVSHHFN